MNMRPNKQEFIDRIEHGVLNALDDTMNTIIREPFKGWQDQDLKDLLPGIRAHAEKLYQEYMQPSHNKQSI